MQCNPSAKWIGKNKIRVVSPERHHEITFKLKHTIHKPLVENPNPNTPTILKGLNSFL
ncbi:hypothetical protein OpiT1DRAFT_00772 [Opitutaceae bacterium TAV1]|nr:hypothetical protein OpiT1DRAFT_00772 [Opitutaceae bacterium TAV1]